MRAGALYIRRGAIRPLPQITGGGQEYGLRPGTLNVPGIAGIGQAAAILTAQRAADARRITGLRDQLLSLLREAIPDIEVNGTLIRRLPGNLNLTIPGIDADTLIERLPALPCPPGQPATPARQNPPTCSPRSASPARRRAPASGSDSDGAPPCKASPTQPVRSQPS
jgi:cysteine desulfurase